MGWIITNGWGTGTIARASVKGPLSSTLAEITALVSAIAAVPPGVSLTIFTDSQNAVDGFYKYVKEERHQTRRKQLRANFWLEWAAVRETMRHRTGTTEVLKVKGHSGIEGNEKADIAANEGRDWPEIIIAAEGIPEFQLIPYAENVRIAGDLRKIVEKIHRTRAAWKWAHTANIAEIEKEGAHKVDWEATFRNLHGQIPFTCMKTSEVDSSLRSYRIKALQGLLPTAGKMHQRRPDLYKDAKCPICDATEEDNMHIWQCPGTLSARVAIVAEAKETWISSTSKDTGGCVFEEVAKLAEQLFGIMTPLGSIFQIRDKSKIDITDPILIAWVMRGIVPSSWIQCTQDVVGSKEKADKIIDKVMSIFAERGRREIWGPRCRRQVERERTLGIMKQQKRTKKSQKRISGIKERRVKEPVEAKERKLLQAAFNFFLEGIKGVRGKSWLLEK
jgi:ribonuclease HI